MTKVNKPLLCTKKMVLQMYVFFKGWRNRLFFEILDKRDLIELVSASIQQCFKTEEMEMKTMGKNMHPSQGS